MRARGCYDRTPASEWHWQLYGSVAPPSPPYTALRSAGLVDPGTGATPTFTAYPATTLRTLLSPLTRWHL